MSDWQQMANADVLTLGMAADEARRAQPNGKVVTYTRVHFVSASALRAGTAIPEVAAEVRLYETPPTLEEALDQVRSLRALAGVRRVSAFSMAELEERQWPRLQQAITRLVEAGLDDVAELPADRLTDLETSIRTLRAAGADPQRITVFSPVGNRKIEVIALLQRVGAAAGPLRRVSPLPRIAPVDKPTTGYDDLRTIALTRLALRDTSVEVDWSLYGPKLAQVALTFGADHLDAVPATDDASLGRRRATVEDVERNIRAVGFEPQEYRAPSRRR